MKFDGTIKQTIYAFLIAFGLSLFINQLASASTLPLPDVGNYGGMVQNPGTINSFEGGVASLVVNVVLNVRYLLTALSIAIMIYAGYKMVIAQGNDEYWKNAKKSMTWGIVGLAMVGLAGEFVRIFAVGKCAELGMLPGATNLSCVEGGFLANPNAIIARATLFNNFVKVLITFLKYFIGGIAVLMLMRNAIRMAANSAGDELAKDKKNLIASLMGLLLIIVADPIINNVFFVVDKSKYPSTTGAQVGINYVQGVKEIVGFTNFLVSILTPIIVLVIVVAGLMYITAAGNPDQQTKAKRMITLSLIGLIIIYGAFAIVSTFIVGQFNGNANANPADKTTSTQALPSS